MFALQQAFHETHESEILCFGCFIHCLHTNSVAVFLWILRIFIIYSFELFSTAASTVSKKLGLEIM